MNYYKKVLRLYATFSGRARRSEYWYFTLFNFLFLLLAVLLDNILGIGFNEGAGPDIGPFYLIYILAIFIPGLAVTVRRLHDVGKSGWFYLILLIPFIGVIWFFILTLTDSQPGENQYGENPKDLFYESGGEVI